MLGVFNPPHSLVPVFEALKPDLPVSQARARRKQVQANILGKQLPLHIRRSAQTFEGHNNSLYIPKVLVYRNSFFTRLGKFILRHFKEADLYSNTYFSFDPTIVKKRHPQLVIEQVTDNGFTVPTDHQN